jgi:hypothetical protein
LKAHDKKSAGPRGPAIDQQEERERLKSIQFPRSGVTRGKDIWDLSTLRHAHRRRGTR